MVSATSDIYVGKLTSKSILAVRRKARKLGMKPADYIKRLIEDDLALDRQAQLMSWDEIMSRSFVRPWVVYLKWIWISSWYAAPGPRKRSHRGAN